MSGESKREFFRKEFEQRYSVQVNKAAPRSHKPFLKIHVRSRLPSYELLIRKATETQQKIQVSGTTVYCHPEVDRGTLLLEMPQTLVIGHKENKLEVG